MRQRPGISLLEVIVAMALATLLLGAVWTLFQLLTKRQLIELNRAETNQLMRSLHQRLSRDLNNLPAIDRRSTNKMSIPMGRDSSTFSPIPWPYGFLEEPQLHSLHLTVLRGDRFSLSLAQFVEPVDWRSEPENDEDNQLETAQGEGGEIHPPEMIKQIDYRLPPWPQAVQDENMADEFSSLDEKRETGERDLVQGLSREERAMWLATGPLTATVWEDAPSSEEIPRQALDENGVESTASVGSAGSRSEKDAHQSIRENVPDVVAAIWAYFDGKRWRSQWDSDQEKRLPAAIRLRWRHRKIPGTEFEGTEFADDANGFEPERMPAEFEVDEEELVEKTPELGSESTQGTIESGTERWYDCEWIFLVQPQPSGQSPLSSQQPDAPRFVPSPHNLGRRANE